jgi:chaperonin GroES
MSWTNKLGIKPLSNRIVVKVDDIKDTTDSGILVSSESQKKPNKGLVLAIGPLVESLKPGDYVTYPEYAGSILVTDGEEYLIMREAEVLAVIG